MEKVVFPEVEGVLRDDWKIRWTKDERMPILVGVNMTKKLQRIINGLHNRTVETLGGLVIFRLPGEKATHISEKRQRRKDRQKAKKAEYEEKKRLEEANRLALQMAAFAGVTQQNAALFLNNAQQAGPSGMQQGQGHGQAAQGRGRGQSQGQGRGRWMRRGQGQGHGHGRGYKGRGGRGRGYGNGDYTVSDGT